MEEGDTIMFVTMDQGNQYKTIFLSINKWTKSLTLSTLYPSFVFLKISCPLRRTLRQNISIL